MQNSLYKLFEHKCVLEVYVHIHPIMITIYPVFFYIPILKSPFSNQAVLRFLSEWRSSVQAPPIIVRLTRPSYLRPALSELRAVRHCVDSGSGEVKMSQIKRLRCFVVHTNHSWSSFIYRWSEYKCFFINLCKPPFFPNNVLVSQ